MHGMAFNVAQAALPVFEGRLDLRDFNLHRKDDVWHWQFAGAIRPISMEKFSAAVGWPKMLGTLAGAFPRSVTMGMISVWMARCCSNCSMVRWWRPA